MAEETTPDEEEQAAPAKKESVVGFLIAVFLVSVIAVGAGWFVGGQLQSSGSDMMKGAESKTKINEKTKQTKKEKPEDEKKEENKNDNEKPKSFVILKPLLVELAKSNNSWVRLELALLVDEEAGLENEEKQLMVSNDLTTFIRTISLAQLSGPSGYLHFREDLIDRARLATEGMVRDVIIVSMVAE